MARLDIDNKLQWLPQRPVYNYYHCEFRFWRNTLLRSLPYSLWYHMFRDQQTRSLNIGCLKIENYQHASHGNRCRLKLPQDSGEWDFDVACPAQHGTIFDQNDNSPPSLYETCRRVFYEELCDAAKKMSDEVYSKYNSSSYIFYEINQRKLKEFFQNGNNDSGSNNTCDLNGNTERHDANQIRKVDPVRQKLYYVVNDILEDNLKYLPRFIKQDLCKGPVSRCENRSCKKPVFDYAYYEFCIRKIILIDDVEDVVLSAVFCSKACANSWKTSQQDTIPWSCLIKTTQKTSKVI